jgi:hypothetical protein
MIDPAVFRRINPNYQLSYIKNDKLDQDKDNNGEDESDNCSCGDNEDDSENEKDKMRMVLWKDYRGKKLTIKLPQSVSASCGLAWASTRSCWLPTGPTIDLACNH